MPKSKSKSKSKAKSQQTRKRSATGPPLDDAIVGAFLGVGVPEENARILAATILSTIGTYEPKARVAAKAQEAAEENAEEIEAADPAAVRAALTEASAATQRGGAPSWGAPILGGIYTPATAALGAAAYAAMQAIRHVLLKAGCDSRVINLACYMIPCLLHALPEILVPGAIPGLSYAPAPTPREKED
jgi:hypothetical protein